MGTRMEQARLKNKWSTPHISFEFLQCPLCDHRITHYAFKALLEAFGKIETSVKVAPASTHSRRGAPCIANATHPMPEPPRARLSSDWRTRVWTRMRRWRRRKGASIETQSAMRSASLHTISATSARSGVSRVCCTTSLPSHLVTLLTPHHCMCGCTYQHQNPYFGGAKRCQDAAAGGEDGDGNEFDEKHLVCGGCSASSVGAGIKSCAKHGTDGLEFKVHAMLLSCSRHHVLVLTPRFHRTVSLLLRGSLLVLLGLDPLL